MGSSFLVGMLVVVYASERVSPSVRSVKTEVVGTGFMVRVSVQSPICFSVVVPIQANIFYSIKQPSHSYGSYDAYDS